MIPGFSDHSIEINGAVVAYSSSGPVGVTEADKPPLLLLHGFPQCRAMWAQIAPLLARDRTVIAADLRGYGASHKPVDVVDASFRAMGADLTGLMSALGFETFDLVGHDRGARTAHRIALDAPNRVSRLCLMDIIPTHLLLDQLSTPVAKAYYHWFFLAQPAPFPETLIAADPDYYFESCLLGWGASKIEDFAQEQLCHYRAAWRKPDVIAGMCNDYRAALEVDFANDRADLDHKITCPILIMYGADGAMAKAYDVPATWAGQCTDMRHVGIPGGHFFPDTAPKETMDALVNFLS